MDVAAADVGRVLELCDDPAFRSVSPIRDGGNVNCGLEGKRGRVGFFPLFAPRSVSGKKPAL
jgi:hypothetical protein